MNFADAIRRAAHESGTPLVPQPPQVEQRAEPSKPPVLKVEKNDAALPVERRREPAVEPPAKLDLVEQELGPEGVPPGNHTVRLEISLTPEQLARLFKGVAAAGRTVMTLGEAARHLRVSPRVLEAMAQEGQIPAILIDGKWRFSRNNLDEWLSKQSFRKEMEA